MNREGLVFLFFFLFLLVNSCYVPFEKYEKRIQTCVNNTVNDLCHGIKFENRVKNRNNFFIKQNIYFLFLNNILKYIKYKIYFFILGKVFFFKISKNSVASASFLPRQILKNIDMPTAEANFECWSMWTYITENLICQGLQSKDSFSYLSNLLDMYITAYLASHPDPKW